MKVLIGFILVATCLFLLALFASRDLCGGPSCENELGLVGDRYVPAKEWTTFVDVGQFIGISVLVPEEHKTDERYFLIYHCPQHDRDIEKEVPKEEYLAKRGILGSDERAED